MTRKLFQRAIAMALCVVMAAAMFPLSVFATAEAGKQAKVTARLAYLDTDQIVSTAYDDESKGSEFKYDRLMYFTITWPENSEMVRMTIDGPVSGTLLGSVYMDHVTSTGIGKDKIYQTKGMSPSSIRQ